MSSDVGSIGMGAGERIDQFLEHDTVRAERRKPSYRFLLGFGLFVLTTATLFIRPGEIIPATETWPIFQILILATLALAHPEMLEQLRPERLMRFPMLLCLLGMPLAIMLSHLIQAHLYSARSGPLDFLKVATYFFLLVGLVNNLVRLRWFLGITILLIAAMSVLALLSYYGLVQIHSMQSVLERGDGGWDSDGTQIYFKQLQATGIFSDPNDLALMLVLAFLGTLYFITTSSNFLAKLLWCLPAATVMFAFALTKSRGGLLSLLAGLGVWLLSRLGWKRAGLLGLLVVPVVFVAFGGRQTAIGLDEGTAQSRLMHWRDGIAMIKSSPLTGVGYGVFSDLSGNAAHNSYLHCYSELGFFGGTLFFGLFALPIVALMSPRSQRRLRVVTDFLVPPTEVLKAEELPQASLGYDLDRMRSVMLAIGVGYAVGLFSLSRSYAASTYLMLGMIGVTGILVAARNPAAVGRLTTRLCVLLIGGSAAWLVFLYVFVKLALRVGGK